MATRTYRCVCAVVMGSISLALAGCETKGQSGAVLGGLGGGYVVGNEMDKADAREESRYQRATRVDRESRYQTSAGSRTVTKRQVIDWTRQGVKDEIIIDRIEQSGTVFSVTVTDENELRDAGVSEEVIRSMKYSHARR